MKKSLLWTILIVIFLVVAGAIYYFSTTDADYSSNTNSVYSNGNTNVNAVKNTNTTVNSSSNINTINTNVVVNQNANTAPTAASIGVSSSGFSPSTTTIAVGGTVTWTNTGTSSVYVAPDNHPSHIKYGSLWSDTGAGEISGGETYSHTFTQAGTYTYHDHLNSSRTGTVIVK